MPLDTPSVELLGSQISVGKADETISSLTTAAKYSSVFDARLFDEVVFYLKNTSDRAITVQLQVAPDADTPSAEWQDKGSAVNMGDGSVTAVNKFIELEPYHAFCRLKVTCDVSNATTGTLTIEARSQKG